jgi:glycerol-3-phosphate dehydrogenase
VGITADAEGRANGATVAADGELIHVAARCIVNAAGVWADEVRSLDEGADPDSIRPAKGVHITIPWEKVRIDIAVIIPVRSDKRSLFLVPWGELPDGRFRHVYVGTTDTDSGEPLDDPQCTGDDIDYVLTALNEALTETVTRDDITGVWAGMRPLVKAASADGDSAKTADLSRRHQVAVSDSGVVRVNGGKLTTYRELAEDTVDMIVRQLDATRRTRRSATRRLSLFGATRSSSGAPGTATAHLARRFGSQADEIRALVAFDPSLGEPLVPGQPYLRAEAVYAARHEMATTLDDVLVRRTRAHLFDRPATLAVAADVADLLASELGWDTAETERQLTHYRALCHAEEAAARAFGAADTVAPDTAGADDDQLANATD